MKDVYNRRDAESAENAQEISLRSIAALREPREQQNFKRRTYGRISGGAAGELRPWCDGAASLIME
jgi:hypothetical protein